MLFQFLEGGDLTYDLNATTRHQVKQKRKELQVKSLSMPKFHKGQSLRIWIVASLLTCELGSYLPVRSFFACVKIFVCNLSHQLSHRKAFNFGSMGSFHWPAQINTLQRAVIISKELSEEKPLVESFQTIKSLLVLLELMNTASGSYHEISGME